MLRRGSKGTNGIGGTFGCDRIRRVPQTTTRGADFRKYRTTVHDVQAKTGLDFFWKLPDPLENKLEGELAEYWLEN